ncbi:MAG: hypothetical protein SNJ29_12425, partial [Rikenellaceae bacterium]
YLIKNGTRATLEQISADLLKVGSDGSQSGDAISASFLRTEVQVSLLRDVISTLETKLLELQSANPDIDQTANIAEVEKLKTQIEELKTQLVQLEQTGENTQVLPQSLPNAKRQFDGLHFSIQQMAREMPSLAMGPQMFFLAISNNLPIFTDELARAKKEYAELIATGQKGTPVWKQVVKPLFSWQTAMTTGIMLLVMYGDEIVKSISDMFGWKSAKQQMREEIEKSIEIEKEANSTAAKTRFELEQTIKSIKNFNGTKDEERQKIDELNGKYGESFGYYQTLESWYDTLTAKAEAYTQVMFLQAKQQSLLSKAIEADQKVEETKKTMAEDVDGSMGWFMKAMMYNAQGQSHGTFDAQAAIDEHNTTNKAKVIAEAEAERDAYLEEMESLYKNEVDIAKENNINEVVAGSVADLENTIAIKRKALKELTDPTEYKKQLSEIETLEARVRSITGAKDPNAKKDNTEKQYQNERLASLKAAADAELELERSKINDKIKLIEFERDAQIEAIETEKLAYEKKYKGGDTSGFDRQIEAVKQQADIDIDAQNKASLKAEIAAHQQYLQEYGTFQQQKYAIAQEYAEKIKNAQTEGERLSLEKELASFNAKIETESLKMNINWSTVFGGFGGMFSDMIKPALEDAKKYLATDSFKNADEASKQALIDAINQMEQSLGGTGSLNFKQLGVDMQYYQDSLIALNSAKQQEIELIGKLADAQKKYNEALESGSQSEIDAAETTLTTAQENADAASTNVQTLTATATQAQTTVNNTATKLSASMDNVTQGLSQIASGSLTGAYNGLIQVSKGVGGVMEKFADRLESVPIIGWIVSIIDIFKDGLSLVIGGLLDAIFNAVSGIINDILSGDLFITIGESLAEGVGKIIDGILTMGGLFNWTGSGESDEDLEKDIDRLTHANENLERALNSLTEVMKDAAVKDSGGIYDEQKSNIEAQIANTQEMMRRSGASYSNGFLGIGGDHSSNYEIDKGMSGTDWSRISDIVGRNIDSAGDFWGLSSEEMAKVADQATDLYSKIQGLADDGHKNAAQYMDEYIEYYKQLEELEEALAEKRTNISFDSLRDNFKSTLADMSSDTEDFGEDLKSTFQNAIIESLMTEKYDAMLKEWYKSFADSMADGEMSQSEKDALQDDYNKMVSDALSDRNALKDVFGWDSSSTTSQSGRSGSFETMTQDQGTKLEGLFTASEMRIARIEDGVESVSMQMNTAVNHLAQIETNTGASATSLQSLVEKVEQVIRDGLKVK